MQKINTISKKQIQLIHIYLKKCGVKDEYYRQKLWNEYKVKSCVALSYKQANVVIKDLEAYAAAFKINLHGEDKGAFSIKTHRMGMATPGQLRKIEALWSDVSYQRTVKEKRKALRQFLTNKFGVSDIRFIPHDMPQKIIKALEEMKRRKKCKTAKKTRC